MGGKCTLRPSPSPSLCKAAAALHTSCCPPQASLELLRTGRTEAVKTEKGADFFGLFQGRPCPWGPPLWPGLTVWDWDKTRRTHSTHLQGGRGIDLRGILCDTSRAPGKAKHGMATRTHEREVVTTVGAERMEQPVV